MATDIAPRFVHFIVALQSEATPLVEHFRLKRIMDERSFPVYRNETITLTISGIGKTTSAAAVAYTQAFFGRRESSVWLNIGIAGAAQQSIGAIYRIHKIADQETDLRWYPALIGRRLCDGAELLTVPKAQTVYSKSCLYDMEATGFYPTAIKFSSSELVQCLKVVSDHDEYSRNRVTSKEVRDLIGNQLDTIDRHHLQLYELANSNSELVPNEYSEFVERWRFTGHEKLQLAQLLKQWTVLFEKSPRSLTIADLATGKDVLQRLKSEIEQMVS